MDQPFLYDPAGKRRTVADASRHVATSPYEALGGITSYAYDPLTYRQTQRLDANGALTTYAYDADLRPTRKAYPSGQILTYLYTAVGNRSQMQDPAGGTTQYRWSRESDVNAIIDAQGLITTITYTGSRQNLREIVYPNGVTLNLGDVGHIVPFIEVQRIYDGPGAAVPFSLQNTYDQVYNRTKSTETDQLGVTTAITFTYDLANQLTREQRGAANAYSTSYLYDSLGNRTLKYDSRQLTTYTYNAANQLLLTPPTGQPTTSTYDGNGNLLGENAGGALITYTWDYENRLSSVATPTTGPTTFLYSDEGHKQRTVTPTTTTNYLWDGNNIQQEQDASGNVQAQYTQAPGTWGMLLGQRRGTTD
jgi:YD repeat-containing protein